MPRWQKLQDALANVTGLAVITVDYKGIPVTRHSGRRPFCAVVRGHPELSGFCQKCDSRGGLEAVRIGHPYIYLCHCKVVDIAIPIIVDDKYIGAVMAGQIRLQNQGEERELEQILHSPTKRLDTEELRQLYLDIPSMPYEQLEFSVNLLFELCNYIVEEAMNKNLVLEMYERIGESRLTGLIPKGHSMDAVESLRREFSEAVTSAYIKSDSRERLAPANRTLQPAFDYIHQNKGEMVTQKKAADLCFLSSGHFSRIFVKETGEHFSSYYSRLKIEWSKQLLEKTDLSIAQISEELGFSESGYFIKTFRKIEGITPAAYRKFIGENVPRAGDVERAVD